MSTRYRRGIQRETELRLASMPAEMKELTPDQILEQYGKRPGRAWYSRMLYVELHGNRLTIARSKVWVSCFPETRKIAFTTSVLLQAVRECGLGSMTVARIHAAMDTEQNAMVHKLDLVKPAPDLRAQNLHMQASAETHDYRKTRTPRERLKALAGSGSYMLEFGGGGGKLQTLPFHAALQMALSGYTDELASAVAMAIAVETLRDEPRMVDLAWPRIMRLLAYDRHTRDAVAKPKTASKVRAVISRSLHVLCLPHLPAPKVAMRNQDFCRIYAVVHDEMDGCAKGAEKAAVSFLDGPRD